MTSAVSVDLTKVVEYKWGWEGRAWNDHPLGENEAPKKAAEPDLPHRLVPGFPDTPQNITKALLKSPPKKPDEWKYAGKRRGKKKDKAGG
ncbi:MAG: hypothetical protein OXC69_08635 [Candidatus Tectomicrobia bacterium]|nr:hypothetical protein [Candidatus Tectomicrobia bacterium]